MTTTFRTDSSGNTGAISFKGIDIIGLASTGATLNGIPRAPTASQGTNTTQVATTEFVTAAVEAVTIGVISPSNSLPQMDALAASPGISTLYSRGDHVHPQFTAGGNTTPLADAVSGAPGTSTFFSRADHVHPASTAGIPQPSNTIPPADNLTGGAGSATTYARGDHAHPQFTFASSNTPSLPTPTGAAGSSTNFSRADHSHPAGAQSLGTSGYVTLPGGLIMQWGTNVFTPAGAAVSFPIPFPNAIFNITLGIGDNSNPPSAVAATGAPSLTGFVGHCSQSFNCQWIALGR